jgi:hypothetical protein
MCITFHKMARPPEDTRPLLRQVQDPGTDPRARCVAIRDELAEPPYIPWPPPLPEDPPAPPDAAVTWRPRGRGRGPVSSCADTDRHRRRPHPPSGALRSGAADPCVRAAVRHRLSASLDFSAH